MANNDMNSYYTGICSLVRTYPNFEPVPKKLIQNISQGQTVKSYFTGLKLYKLTTIALQANDMRHGHDN